MILYNFIIEVFFTRTFNKIDNKMIINEAFDTRNVEVSGSSPLYYYSKGEFSVKSGFGFLWFDFSWGCFLEKCKGESVDNA